MGRVSVLFLVSLLLPGLAGAQGEFEKRYAGKVAEFQRENASLDPSKRHVVLFGSSSMEGWRLRGWTQRFLAPIQGRVLNRGISGDGIGLRKQTGLYNRIQGSVVDASPSHVFLLNGRNSLSTYGAARTAERYREVVREIRRALPQAVVCVVTCAPVRGRYARLKDGILDLNRRLRTLAEQEGAVLIDLHPLLVDESGLLREEVTRDGLHFTDAGYRILGREILRVVDESEGTPSEPEQDDPVDRSNVAGKKGASGGGLTQCLEATRPD